MGLSPSELYAMELRDFFSAYDGWAYLYRERVRSDMERARWMAGAIISPWIKAQKPLTELLPLPWDIETTPPTATPDYDPNDIEARRKRVAELLKNRK